MRPEKSERAGDGGHIIHNSDYKTLDDAKAAIDRHFADRNAHFLRERPPVAVNNYAVRPRPPRGAAPPRHGALYVGSEEYAAARQHGRG
jgi:hypothetical protein